MEEVLDTKPSASLNLLLAKMFFLIHQMKIVTYY